jgi:hypothetical protein
LAQVGFSLNMLPLNQFKRFDVRDLIQRGVEPFPEIRKLLKLGMLSAQDISANPRN